MNVLAIHASHDGCVTYIKNNKIVFHTQIDRYNRFKHCSFPVKKLIEEIEKLSIDKVLLTCVDGKSSVYLWNDILRNESKCKNLDFIYYEDAYHHLLHAYCALTWNKNIKNILVCDGRGTKYKNIFESESLYSFDKHLITENNMIGERYEAFSKKHFDSELECGKTMAWSLHDKRPKKIQKRFENDMTSIIDKWNIKDNLLFTGGCAQNVLYNSKLLPKFNKLFCDPFNGDFGLSLGAANFYLNNQIKNDQIYLGIPQELNTDIFLKHKICNVKPDEVAKILLKEPVAIFQSRSEQGQRGLGNRSLLMSPLDNKAHDKLNKIKKREWFRPFACSILKEDAKNWFDMDIEESPYMMYVFKLKKEGILKAGIAIDNKSRIQTVSKKNNLHYYNLIKAFKKTTKVPILINTSLNLPGEVLVETMQDLKDLFDKSLLNYIYLPEIGKIIKKNHC